MSQSLIYAALGAVILVLLVMVIRKRSGSDSLVLHQRLEALNTGLLQQMQQFQLLLQQQLQEHRNSLVTQQQHVGSKLDQTTEMVGRVQERLARLDEGSKQILAVGKDIASLQEILQAPKLRGSLGELFLGDMLAQMLSRDQYTLQHTFKSGERVDAVVKLRDGYMVPIDAKFPLENFRRAVSAKEQKEKDYFGRLFKQDVKKHIDVIAQKYILPAEGTFDFALMYVPAENIYYETVLKEDHQEALLAYAFPKKVIPVSPSTLYIYIQAILLGLKGMRVEEEASRILRHLQMLQNEFGKFAKGYSTLGGHIQSAQTKYLETERQITKIGVQLDTLDIERPKLPDVQDIT